ncbi:MAG TPA: helix-turn-helix transcriptional regulator [Verrucomicrobiae bacterium]|nr:helix-turn-helix transcriptional regulator [Verrucomicrobiae bacterium]
MQAELSMTKEANQSGDETGKHPDHYLAEWREYRGYSQRELGDLVSASNSKISRIEAGVSELRPSFAKKVARFFNIPLAALFTINPLGEGREAAEMLDAINDIDPKDRAAALRMLRSLGRSTPRNQAG